MATGNSGALVTPGALDPISEMLSKLMAPNTRSTQSQSTVGGTTTSTTVNNADTAALKSLITQLQTGSTPAGAADIIKQIFATGTQAAAPSINQTAQATGARSGTSSYRALALNDMNARLAGQAAVELNRNVQTAAQAAGTLAQVTQAPTQTIVTTPKTSTQVTTEGNQFSIENLLAPVAVGGIKTLLTDMLTPKTAAKAVSAAELLGPTTANGFNYSADSILAPMNQGGSMTDFIVNNAGVAPSLVSSVGAAPVAGDFIDFSGNAFAGSNVASTAPSAVPGTGMGISLAMNELMGGGTNSDTIGAAAVDYFSGGTTALASAAGNALGINEVGQVLNPVYSVAGDVVQGAGNAVQDLASSISDAAGTVICTELNRQGLLSDTLYAAYARKLADINPVTMRGYHLWAKPVVRAMQHGAWYSKVLVALAKPFVLGRAAHITGSFSLAGLATVYIGEPVCYVLGKLTPSSLILSKE